MTASARDDLCQKALEDFRSLIIRRLQGECAAYILGRKEFWGLEFLVNPSVLVPRPDTETLVEAALEFLKGLETPVRVLDLCTGSGAVAVALKREIPQLEIWAADICAQALETARTNAARLLSPDAINFCQGNLFKALPVSHHPFELIVSNPPYIPSGEIKNLSREVQGEPLIALDGGADGLEIIRKIISQVPQHLTPKGRLLLEASPDQMESIISLLEESGFGGIKSFKDMGGQQRVICAQLWGRQMTNNPQSIHLFPLA